MIVEEFRFDAQRRQNKALALNRGGAHDEKSQRMVGKKGRAKKFVIDRVRIQPSNFFATHFFDPMISSI